MAELEKARNCIFVEICYEFKQRLDHRYRANRYFNLSRAITKESSAVGVWLESDCHILDPFCLPWLQKAAPLAQEARILRGEVRTLKDENASYQKQIIEPQNKLVEKQG